MSAKEVLTEREFELVNIVGAQLAANQRDLSRHMDLSLGALNMLLRRLVSKGYIRIEQLNKRKVRYLLTPKGFSEKMRKSVKYTLKTLHSISLIKERLKNIIQKLYAQGAKNFLILGSSDLALLVENAIRQLPDKDCTATFIQEIPKEKAAGVILICKEDIPESLLNGYRAVDVLRELAQDHDLLALNKN